MCVCIIQLLIDLLIIFINLTIRLRFIHNGISLVVKLITVVIKYFTKKRDKARFGNGHRCLSQHTSISFLSHPLAHTYYISLVDYGLVFFHDNLVRHAFTIIFGIISSLQLLIADTMAHYKELIPTSISMFQEIVSNRYTHMIVNQLILD